MREKKLKTYQDGQAMILTVLIVGASILGASTIAGYLMTLKIRQSTDTINSTKAIFAADAGIEWELYRKFKDAEYPKPQFTNDADFTTFVEETKIKSRGNAGNSYRAFEVHF